MTPIVELPPFPEVIDNSQRSEFVRCPQSWAYRYLFNWQPKIKSIHLRAGGAFATGIEIARKAFYVEGKSDVESVAEGWRGLINAWEDHPGDDFVKDSYSMSSALAYYFQAFPLRSDFVKPATFAGKAMIEFSAVQPLPVSHPTTGQPMLYYGRHDMVGQRTDSQQLMVVDEKTASQLGPTWVESWNLDSQFTGYIWMDQQAGIDVSMALIRGISITGQGNHAHAQSIQSRPAWRITQWLDQVVSDVEDMQRQYKRGWFSKSLGPGCKMYGGCAFKNVCCSNQPERWLSADFVQERYAPWEILHAD